VDPVTDEGLADVGPVDQHVVEDGGGAEERFVGDVVGGDDRDAVGVEVLVERGVPADVVRRRTEQMERAIAAGLQPVRLCRAEHP